MRALLSQEPAGAEYLDGAGLDYARALQNILEDAASEQELLRESHRAVLNILDDAASEREELRKTQVAMLNILEDLSERRERLEEIERAVLNILEDLAFEKHHLEEAQGDLLKSEHALRSSLHEKETLLKEIHHRVKNNLQVIASLLRLQSRGADQQVRNMFEESQNRVLSISLVHETLYQAGDLARLEFGPYLHALAEQLVKGWEGTRINLTVNAESVQLGVDTAIPCGLIVNELVTNSLKHAFPKRNEGAIRVALEPAEKQGWLNLSIEDDGVGLPEGAERGRPGSLGMELVATLVRQLRGRTEIRRNPGTAFEIQFQPDGRL